MACFTLDVIASTAFGMDINSQKDPDNEFVKKAKLFASLSFTTPLAVLGGTLKYVISTYSDI